MASVGRDRNGTRRILFIDPADGRRRTIRLGRCSQRQAQAVKVKVEHLVKAKIMGGDMDDEVARWVTTIGDDLHTRLAGVGLLQGRVNAKLGEFLHSYMEGRRAEIKPQTAVHLGHTIRNLLAFFDSEKPLREITEQDAIGFRSYLVKEGLAEATVRRRCGIGKQFFAAAMEGGMIGNNPFKSKRLPCSVRGNKERQFFVTPDMTEQILTACPDAEWRLLVSLARFAGLRTPSESLRLRWQDIDWERGRFTVHSPKTEHHSGHESRVVPLFQEVREPLMQVFEAAEDGAEFCITRYRPNNLNLRTQFERIVRRAGLRPWPRLWQNCRSSRQTELCQDFPEHVVCAWMGNSKLVAREHYEQLRDADFERAAQCAQKAAQQPSAPTCTERKPTPKEDPENADLLVSAGTCEAAQKGGLGPEGFEPSTKGL